MDSEAFRELSFPFVPSGLQRSETLCTVMQHGESYQVASPLGSGVIPTQQTHENLLSNRVCVPAGQKLEIATPLVLAVLLVRIWYESCRSSYQAVLAVLGRV